MPLQIVHSPSTPFRLEQIDQPNPWRAGIVGLGIDLGLEDSHLVEGDKCDAINCQFIMSKSRRHKFACSGRDSGRDMTSDKLVEQMAVLGHKLQHLETVEFDYSVCGIYDAPFPIRAISRLLFFRKDTIRSLKLARWQSLIGGTQEEFQEFFQCLRMCTKLKEFSFRCGCQFEVTDQFTSGVQPRWVEECLASILGSSMECVDAMACDDFGDDFADDFHLDSSDEFEFEAEPYEEQLACCQEGAQKLWLHVEPAHQTIRTDFSS